MPDAIAERWARREQECGFAITTRLVACGADLLPEEAAPCLTFDRVSAPAPLWDVFGSPKDWAPSGRDRLAPYRMIGSDGAGNPICLEQPAGTVVLLDHEDGFRTKQFVNGSVAQLGECLLAYMGEKDGERFRSAVRAIDPAAMSEGTFWWYETAGMGA